MRMVKRQATLTKIVLALRNKYRDGTLNWPWQPPTTNFLVNFSLFLVIQRYINLVSCLQNKIISVHNKRAYGVCRSIGSSMLNLDSRWKWVVNFNIRLLNPLKPELNPICYLLALLGAHHFLHVNRIRVKLLTFRLLMSYIYGAPILDVSRSHTTTQHSR